MCSICNLSHHSFSIHNITPVMTIFFVTEYRPSGGQGQGHGQQEIQDVSEQYFPTDIIGKTNLNANTESKIYIFSSVNISV